jgi:ABC-2 type transport system ATP-binding protein
MNAVQTESLTRVFASARRRRRPEVVALDGVSIAIPPGEIHGILGPNGAGKTTLVKILSTVLLPTSGSAHVLGHDVVAETQDVRRAIGIVFGGERGLYWRLTARENLEYAGALYKLPTHVARRRAAKLLERVGLDERADELIETFSRGMKQRLHLARGLIGDPKVLFLDEPTTGLDPVASHEFRALVRGLNEEGRTILLTTHDMVEAEAVCDRVTLIDHGRVLATEQPREIGRMISRYERIDVEGADEGLIGQLRALPGVAAVAVLDDGSTRVETDEEGATAVVLERLVASGITSIRTSLPSLEEVYHHHFGQRGLEV